MAKPRTSRSRVGVALLGGHRREAREHRRALADLVEEGGLGPLGDVGGHLEVAEGAAALDVVHAVGDALADEVGQLLDQVGVLQQDGAAGAGRERVLIAGDRDNRHPWWLVIDCSSLSSPLSSGPVDLASTFGRLKRAVSSPGQLLGPGAVQDDLDEVDPLEACSTWLTETSRRAGAGSATRKSGTHLGGGVCR